MAAQKRKKKKKAGSIATSVIKTGLFILLILVVTYLLVTYVFRKTIVHNVSMMNTLYDGDNIIMDELSYNTGDPKRYDIICFKSYKERDLLIKRVIGLPGETVHIEDGEIFINGKKIKDKAGLEKIENPGLASGDIELLDDEYFVIGDNRDESIDSRSEDVGNVRRREILGKAVLVIWPVKHIKVIK